MKKKVFIFCIFTKAIFSQAVSQNTDNIMLLNPQTRGQDLLQSYNSLKNLIPSYTQQIFFRLRNGTTITDINTVSLLSQNTMLFIESTQTSEIRYFFVPVENIVEIDYID